MDANNSLSYKVKEYFIQKYNYFLGNDFRGYRVESGFKYGCDYILYDNDEQTHKHGEALLFVNQPNSCINLSHQLTSFIRLASIVHKKAYFAYCLENEVFLLFLILIRFVL